MTVERLQIRPLVDVDVLAQLQAGIADTGAPTGSHNLRDLEGIAEFRTKMRIVDDDTVRCGGKIEFEDITVPGLEDDPDVPILVLRRSGTSTPRPVLVVTQCGGKVVSDTRLGLSGNGILDWVVDFDVVVVIVKLRVGPEDPHPAQVRDGYAALSWVAANTDRVGAAKGRVSLAGISGGGGIAAAVALYARDHGGPDLERLILLTPMLDDRGTTPSNLFEENVGGWDRLANETGWRAILGDNTGGPYVSPYAAPARAQDLAGLPPTYLNTGSADIFRDETIEFGARLAEAGVPVELHVWAGAIHGSDGLAPDAEVSIASVSARASYFRRAFCGAEVRYV